MTDPVRSDPLLHVFRFRVDFYEDRVEGKPKGGAVPLCGGRFSECSGLEATMEPKVIRAGGHNYGDFQRAGRVSFGTVVLKRGLTPTQHLWRWFDLVAGGKTALRLKARLVHVARGDADPETSDGLLTWELRNALPVKFKAATYDSSGAEIGVEELHFVHEGLSLVKGSGGGQ